MYQSTSVPSTEPATDRDWRLTGRAGAAAWIGSGLLGAAAAWMAYGTEPGLHWLLLAAGLAGALLLVERPSRADLRTRRYQALGALVVLSGAAAVTCNRADQFLLLLGLGWLVAVAACLAACRPASLGPGGLVGAPLAAPVRVARESSAEIGAALRAAGHADSTPVLRGALIALVIVVVFVALLGEADPTLAGIRDGVVELVSSVNGVARVAFGGLVAFATLGFLRAAVRPVDDSRDIGAVRPSRRHTDLERLIILGCMASLFLAFLLLQLGYLFGNPGARAGSGVTLAEAVHRGFGEISVVVSLTAAILVLLERDALHGARERWVRLLALIVLAECVLLLASAYVRVSAYEAAYGYTVFRLYVRLYVGALAAIVLLLARELDGKLDLARLCWRAALVALAALAVLSYWNYSAWIVRANVERYVDRGMIDVEYLKRLDVNALPALVEALPKLAPPARVELRDWILVSSFPARVPGVFAQPRYAWNLRRAQSLAALEALRHASP